MGSRCDPNEQTPQKNLFNDPLMIQLEKSEQMVKSRSDGKNYNNNY